MSKNFDTLTWLSVHPASSVLLTKNDPLDIQIQHQLQLSKLMTCPFIV